MLWIRRAILQFRIWMLTFAKSRVWKYVIIGVPVVLTFITYYLYLNGLYYVDEILEVNFFSPSLAFGWFVIIGHHSGWRSPRIEYRRKSYYSCSSSQGQKTFKIIRIPLLDLPYSFWHSSSMAFWGESSCRWILRIQANSFESHFFKSIWGRYIAVYSPKCKHRDWKYLL